MGIIYFMIYNKLLILNKITLYNNALYNVVIKPLNFEIVYPS